VYNATLAAILTIAAALGFTLIEPPRVTATTCATLQGDLNTALEGTRLELPPGVQCVGHVVLPASHGGTLTTAGFSLPRGFRALASDHGRFAELRSPDNQPALTTAAGAMLWTVEALEITSASAKGTGVSIGTNLETTVAQLPKAIKLSHVYVHGDPITGLKRGVALHAVDAIVEDSTITDIRAVGEDSQALWINNGPGPYTIRNNDVQGSSEPILVGGDRVSIPDLVPGDILIEGNDVSKPLAWRALKGWNSKNLLEVKNGRRILIRGNRFANNWPDAQSGYAILFTPRNQYGSDPWTVIEDVTFEGNTVRNVSSAINIAGDDDLKPSQRTHGITLRNNLLVVDRVAMGGDGRCLMVGRGPQQLTYSQNTCISNGGSAVYTYAGGAQSAIADAVFDKNIWIRNTYGFFATSGQEGTGALATFYPGAVWTSNVMAGGSIAAYKAGTFVPSVAELMGQFVDPAAGDYRIRADSTFAGLGSDRR